MKCDVGFKLASLETTDAPTIYIMLKDFAGPVATIVASIAAGSVAYMPKRS